jgi:hypothetical protein
MAKKKSRARGTSRKKTCNESAAYKIVPPQIRPLVSHRNILASEIPQDYDNLFTSLIAMYSPKDARQWLRIKELQDLIWEKQRMSRMKSAIIDFEQVGAVEDILQSLPMEFRMGIASPRMEKPVLDWFADQKERKKLVDLLKCFNRSEATVDARALVRCLPDVERLERLEAANQLRQQMHYQRFDEDLIIHQLPKKTNDNNQQPAELGYCQNGEDESSAADEYPADQAEHREPGEELGDADAGQEVSLDKAVDDIDESEGAAA